MDGQKLLHRFEFHQDYVFDEQVYPITTVQTETLVAQGQMHFSSER